LSEDWQTFAARVPGRDPGLTIKHGEAVALADAGAQASPQTSKAHLPVIDLGEPGKPAPVDLDLEVTGLLGEGGMGRVLLARQRSLGREVAVKIVKPEVAKGETLGALFDEALVTGALEHPNVVPVHALGRDRSGRPVLVMKRIEGVSWKDLAADDTHPRWSDLAPGPHERLEAHIGFALAACNALSFAHARGFVHRDVKLENVMIGRFGEVYVVDWGIAIRAPVPGGRTSTAGTPSYMAPELARGDLEKTDARTDVYLLGATLHHALTGCVRHEGDTIYAVIFAAIRSQPFDYGDRLPGELAAILNRATSADPENRFASVSELKRALADFLRHRGSIALSDEASRCLAELGTALAAGNTDERRVASLVSEARFGFRQAHRAWPENPAARAGAVRTIELATEHELSRRDSVRTRALLADLGELGAASPALTARADQLDAELGQEAEEKARLERLDRDQDIKLGGGAQLAVLGMLPAAFIGAFAYVFTRGRVLTGAEMVAGPALGFVVLAVALLRMRSKLQTSISRRALAAVALTPLFAILHRVIGLRLDEGVASMVAGDLVLAALAFVLLGVTLVPRVALVALPFAVGGVATALWPVLAMPIFAASVASGFGLMIATWRSMTRH
jgi:serine/threonine-protein kinase